MASLYIERSANLGKISLNNAGMKSRTDLNLGEVVYVSVVYHNYWWVVIFICEDMTAKTSNTTRRFHIFSRTQAAS